MSAVPPTARNPKAEGSGTGLTFWLQGFVFFSRSLCSS